MYFLKLLFSELWFAKFGAYSDTSMENLSKSMTNIPCGTGEDSEGCQDESSALILKFVAIAAILAAGFLGVGIPLVGKNCRFLRTESNLFVIVKAFAAGVILATGFVHILPDATSTLTDPCLTFPWSKFPFAGFIAMMAALATQLVDFLGTQYYEKKENKINENVRADQSVAVSESEIVPAETGSCSMEVFEKNKSSAMHIVGMYAHVAHHGHSQPQEQAEGHQAEQGHGHSHVIGGGDEEGIRHIIVSQVLELGIVSHSVIIGLSLGVSHSPCTVRPLIGALSFHQFFEGFALGGCISQAKFGTLRSTIMACCFAITTPLGIAVGIGISSIYNANSPRALIIEGIFDSISAGILVYMALVDLIAADFLSKKLSCNFRLQVASYLSLVLGAILMSSLAIWA